jgi:RNA polymerase sigma factor (sigma-70 family)
VTVALEDKMAIKESAAGAPAETTTWDRAADCCTRWLDGDTSGLDELVRLMTPVLWQVARACSLTEQEAEDVVQTTWVSFVRSAGRLRDAQSVGGWLTTSTRREAWRVSKTGNRTTFVEDDTLERVVPRERSAEAEVVTRDESDLLWSAVRALDQRCQMLLRVVAFADRPDYAGIARDLGMPVGSIGPTRMRCLRKLKALLDDRSSS